VKAFGEHPHTPAMTQMNCSQSKFFGSYKVTLLITGLRHDGSEGTRKVEIWTSDPRDDARRKSEGRRRSKDIPLEGRDPRGQNQDPRDRDINWRPYVEVKNENAVVSIL
jgi:hypothetical protein